jgi:hypothetical protein
MLPVDAPSDNPGGSEPTVTAYEYGAVPPLPLTVCEYATACVPFGRVAGETVIAGQLVISTDSLSVPVHPSVSVTVTVYVNVPFADGVPLIWPAAESRRLVGSDPAVTA